MLSTTRRFVTIASNRCITAHATAFGGWSRQQTTLGTQRLGCPIRTKSWLHTGTSSSEFTAHSRPTTPPNDSQARNRQVEDQIVQKALDLVPTYGWSERAVVEAVQALGYPPILHGIVPGGPVGLVEHFLQRSRREMNKQLAASPLDPQASLLAKLQHACQVRLQLTVPVIGQWQEATALLAQPSHIPIAIEQLYDLVDDMWYYAGDKSHTMDWYSKRVSLAGVYTATEMYMTEDRSPNFEATFEFLERRLKDVDSVSGLVGEATGLLSFATRSTFNVLVSVSK
ncbi:Ubiquinone biosynthesis protein coq9, mitochondrial [Dispira parvispora]|uniref:Ubiquinone biosynthesis protein n=1 Tax=Dispira parvispora TaxID=1520584 RepID=A0A9W8EAD9_9FUNG|nr:Ubiquinone biosynthesis protein coq9, mitochondrial [Dispira parvispora]